jgi:hypothetical protein
MPNYCVLLLCALSLRKTLLQERKANEMETAEREQRLQRQAERREAEAKKSVRQTDVSLSLQFLRDPRKPRSSLKYTVRACARSRLLNRCFARSWP